MTPYRQSVSPLAYQDLVALGYQTGGTLDCRRVGSLQQPCQDAVRRWHQLATDPASPAAQAHVAKPS